MPPTPDGHKWSKAVTSQRVGRGREHVRFALVRPKKSRSEIKWTKRVRSPTDLALQQAWNECETSRVGLPNC